MIWNIVLLILLFGVSKKKRSPYVAAAILGVIKGGLYYAATSNLWSGVVGFVIFFGLSAAMVFLLSRLDRKAPVGPAYGTPGVKTKESVAWEWYPLSLVAVLIVFGETFIALFIQR